MREIKFRAWTGNSMEHNVIVDNIGNFYAYIDPKDTASAITTKYSESVKVMQYTGLKDKNGKEIYEGDIVKSLDANGANGQSEVFYGYGQWQPFSYLGTYNGDSFEIIGNIYENPNLIK